MSDPESATQTPDEADAAARAITDRRAALGTLVASVAHEINNPITYVLGNLGELERLTAAMREALGSPGDDPAGKIDAAGGLELLDELFADIYEGAGRIRDLVRDLLSLSWQGERPCEPLDVHEILDSTLRLAGRQISHAASLERDYAATRPVRGDRPRLGGVFLNLITNAVQSCEPPDPERQRLVVRTRDSGAGIAIEFEDTGTGIPHEYRERVFAPFFTTRASGEGTGLGLHISLRTVLEHGGSLSFRDREGGGTIFTVELPAPPAPSL